jgi:acetyltransferase-like isoleucine patch superfamily enzyme
MSIEDFLFKVRRRDNRFYSKVKDILQGIVVFNFPAPRWIFKPLYEAVVVFRYLIHIIPEKFFYVPVFKARCERCGKGLSLPNGIPWVEGNLRIEIGEKVMLDDNIFVSGRAVEKPVLTIGDRTGVGYKTAFSVGKRIEIGNDVMIAGGCFIADNDGHPLDPARRLKKESLSEEDIKPIRIEDNSWIGIGAVILKGVTIGTGSVVTANSVVTRSVPPYSMVIGVPARVIMTGIDRAFHEKASAANDGGKDS